MEIRDRIEESIDKVIEYINYTDGFTVIGWCKRGRINDPLVVTKQMTESKLEKSTIISNLLLQQIKISHLIIKSST